MKETKNLIISTEEASGNLKTNREAAGRLNDIWKALQANNPTGNPEKVQHLVSTQKEISNKLDTLYNLQLEIDTAKSLNPNIPELELRRANFIELQQEIKNKISEIITNPEAANAYYEDCIEIIPTDANYNKLGLKEAKLRIDKFIDDKIRRIQKDLESLDKVMDVQASSIESPIYKDLDTPSINLAKEIENKHVQENNEIYSRFLVFDSLINFLKKEVPKTHTYNYEVLGYLIINLKNITEFIKEKIRNNINFFNKESSPNDLIPELTDLEDIIHLLSTDEKFGLSTQQTKDQEILINAENILSRIRAKLISLNKEIRTHKLVSLSQTPGLERLVRENIMNLSQDKPAPLFEPIKKEVKKHIIPKNMFSEMGEAQREFYDFTFRHFGKFFQINIDNIAKQWNTPEKNWTTSMDILKNLLKGCKEYLGNTPTLQAIDEEIIKIEELGDTTQPLSSVLPHLQKIISYKASLINALTKNYDQLYPKNI